MLSVLLGCARGRRRALSLPCLASFQDLAESTEKTPVVHYCAMSALESRHKAPITDIQWLPSTFEVSGGGRGRAAGGLHAEHCGAELGRATIWCVWAGKAGGLEYFTRFLDAQKKHFHCMARPKIDRDQVKLSRKLVQPVPMKAVVNESNRLSSRVI